MLNLTSDRKTTLRTSMRTQPTVATVERKINCRHSEERATDSLNAKAHQSESDNEGIGDSLPQRKKQKRASIMERRKQKQPSVKCLTVSVTRLDSPIIAGNSHDFLPSLKKEKHSKSSRLESNSQVSEQENQNLRISISIPNEAHSSKSSLASSSSSLSPCNAITVTSKTSSIAEEDDVFSDSADNKYVEQDRDSTPFLASPLPNLDSELAGTNMVTITLPHVGVDISERPSVATKTNPVFINSSKISIGILPKEGVVADEPLCSPGEVGSAGPLVTSGVVDSVVASQSPTLTPAQINAEESDTECDTECDEMKIDTDIGEVTVTEILTSQSAIQSVSEETISCPSADQGMLSQMISISCNGSDRMDDDSAITKSEVPMDCGTTTVVVGTSCIQTPTNPSSEVEVDGATKLTHFGTVVNERLEDLQPTSSCACNDVPTKEAKLQPPGERSVPAISSQGDGREVEAVGLKKKPRKPTSLLFEGFLSKSRSSNGVAVSAAPTTVAKKSHSLSKPPNKAEIGLAKLPAQTTSTPKPNKADIGLVKLPAQTTSTPKPPNKVYAIPIAIAEQTHSSPNKAEIGLAKLPELAKLPAQTTSSPKPHYKVYAVPTAIAEQTHSSPNKEEVGHAKLPAQTTSSPKTHYKVCAASATIAEKSHSSPKPTKKEEVRLAKLPASLMDSHFSPTTPVSVGYVRTVVSSISSPEQSSSDLVLNHTVSTGTLVSEAVKLAAKKTAHDGTQTKSDTSSSSSSDPDVIITGVESSKETGNSCDQSKPKLGNGSAAVSMIW